MSWHRYPVTRLRPVMVADGHGNHVPDWTTPAEAEVGAFLFAPSTAATEQLAGREHGVRVAANLYGPAGADVTAGDAVRFDDGPYAGRYRVVGEPQRWVPGTVLEVERWDG
jgi:plastocyanin